VDGQTVLVRFAGVEVNNLAAYPADRGLEAIRPTGQIEYQFSANDVTMSQVATEVLRGCSGSV
jgi:hypothetical protein